MSLLIVLGALIFLMFVAYRGYSVILFAPIAALGAVLLTDPSLVPPLFSSVFTVKMVGFVKNYFLVFMPGAARVEFGDNGVAGGNGFAKNYVFLSTDARFSWQTACAVRLNPFPVSRQAVRT
jgi:hypothetical protein